MTDTLQRVGVFAGPLAALLLYLLLPDSYAGQDGDVLPLDGAARATAAIGLWMAVWWISEAIPVYATALLPLALFPLAGVAPARVAAESYSNPVIYLFLGGFVVALAVERCGLHRRIALSALRLVGSRPRRIVGAFMAISAGLSMWVTNTATTIMLLPVALSVIGVLPKHEGTAAKQDHHFTLALLLGIAYAASIGGIGTLVGTAPNAFIASFIAGEMGVEISFARWMGVGVPLVLVFVPLTWLVLTRLVFPVSPRDVAGAAEVISQLRSELGPMRSAERRTLVVFVLTAMAWVCRPLLNELTVAGYSPLAGLGDPGIAMLAALALFLVPSGNGGALMDWPTATRLPWGLLLLFGGGLSLAAALNDNGISAFVGNQALALGALPTVLLVAAVCAMMIFLTELTSNTATTATMIPIFYAVAVGLGVDPYLLIIPAVIAASCAFMLPVATPPNAIVFGSGHVRTPEMCRAGLLLNLLGIVLITGLTYALVIPLLMVNP